MKYRKLKKNVWAVTAPKEDISKKTTQIYNEVTARIGKIKSIFLIRDEDEAYSNGYKHQIKHIKVNYKKDSLIILETR